MAVWEGGNGSWVSPVLLDRFPATVGGRGTDWIRSATAVQNTKTPSTVYLKMCVKIQMHICICDPNLNESATLMFMKVERKVQKPQI